MKPGPLAAASAVFFFLWATMAVTLATGGAIGSRTVIFALSLISLAGSVEFLRAMRRESPRWRQGIPFVAVCTALALWMGMVEWTVTVPDIANRALLFLLPPAAALLLSSLPDGCRGRVRMPIIVTVCISAVSLILAGCAFAALAAPHLPLPGFTGALAVMYALLLMPLVGLLLVVTGAACR